MHVYLICPVRNATEEDRAFTREYVAKLEHEGHSVHFPPRDSDQTEDGIGLRVNESNRQGILNADEVHIFWDPRSTGSHFDLGMVFMLRAMRGCPIRVINTIEKTETKSYGNIILELASRS
ncbi:MAG TPA: hypothetical protein VKS81_05055 [Bacteroidota bacterium]|nr:hypothetical protein [Bacteroidota bacterium]